MRAYQGASKPRPEKEHVVKMLREQFLRAEGVFLFCFDKVSVAQDRKFRKRFASMDVMIRVAKNTLIRRALDGTPFGDALHPFLRNSTLLLIVRSDLPRVARELKGILDSDEINLVLKGGAIPGKSFGPEGLQELASLPTRSELIARFAIALRSPITRLAQTLSSPLHRLGYALSSLVRQKEQASS